MDRRTLKEGKNSPNLNESVERFYDDLAEDYHHIYVDWEAAIERQSSALDRLIRDQSKTDGRKLLDCSCGIGIRAIGLAQQGYDVAASDISSEAVARAKSEAATQGSQPTDDNLQSVADAPLPNLLFREWPIHCHSEVTIGKIDAMNKKRKNSRLQTRVESQMSIVGQTAFGNGRWFPRASVHPGL